MEITTEIATEVTTEVIAEATTEIISRTKLDLNCSSSNP